MKRIELESKSAICIAQSGESVSYPINSIPGISSAGSGQRGFIRRVVDRTTVLVYLQPCDAMTGGIALDGALLAPLFEAERTELDAVVQYWQQRATAAERRAMTLEKRIAKLKGN